MRRISDFQFERLLELERCQEESRQMLWLIPWLLCCAIFLVAVLKDIFLWGWGR